MSTLKEKFSKNISLILLDAAKQKLIKFKDLKPIARQIIAKMNEAEENHDEAGFLNYLVQHWGFFAKLKEQTETTKHQSEEEQQIISRLKAYIKQT